MAEASDKIDNAESLLYRMTDVVDDHARRGVELEPSLRTRNRLDCATASQLIKEAMDFLVSAHDTSAFADVSPLQRIFRDLNVASRHTGTAVAIPTNPRQGAPQQGRLRHHHPVRSA